MQKNLVQKIKGIPKSSFLRQILTYGYQTLLITKGDEEIINIFERRKCYAKSTDLYNIDNGEFKNIGHR